MNTRRFAWAFVVATSAAFWISGAVVVGYYVTPKAHIVADEHPVQMRCFPPGTEKRTKVGGSDGCHDIDPPAEYRV